MLKVTECPTCMIGFSLCSECGKPSEKGKLMVKNHKFCPYCGTAYEKMVQDDGRH